MGVHIEDTNGSLRRWESDLAGWEIPRMAREMFYMQAESIFQATQEYTHVQTGSLRSSGKIHISYDATRAVLEAEIVYGGPSTGVHNPVKYSVYEASRGPEHNPLTPLYAAGPSLELLLSHGDLMIKGKLT